MIQIFSGAEEYPQHGVSPVVTIGNFDGVHRGHQKLLHRLLSLSSQRKAPSCVYTFEPPPRVLLAPNSGIKRLFSLQEKLRMLEQCGVQQVVLEPFTYDFSSRPPTWFVEHILKDRLRIQALLVGYDFRFGKGRKGDINSIRQLAPDLHLEQLTAELAVDGIISSSRIRTLLRQGEVKKASHLLGRHHYILGEVVSGEQRGRKIGFPTANLRVSDNMIPSSGVYLVQLQIGQEAEWRYGVANLGTQPTFDGESFRVEIHILDFSKDIYGEKLHLQFISKLRDEQKFSTTEELIVQLQCDVKRARERID